MSEVERPNIVLVVMDTARAKNFSCYGYDKKITPFLDSLAEENVKYEHVVTQANWTFPSHASFFSGEYTFENGKQQPESCGDLDTFVEELSEKGYRTIAISNNNFISPDFDYDQIFDRMIYNDRHDIYLGLDIDPEELNEKHDSQLGKYIDVGKSILGSGKIGRFFQGLSFIAKDRLFLRDSGASETNRKVEEELDDIEDDFFLFLNYTEPHAKYRPPFPFTHKFQESKFMLKRIKEVSDHELKVYLRSDREPEGSLMKISENLYNGELNYLDGRMEQLYNYISEEYPNTVFIFTSDHGEYFYEHEKIGHVAGLHEEVTHVPFIEVFPDGRSEDVEETAELRNLHDHILELSECGMSLMNTEGISFSEFYGSTKQFLENFIEKESDIEKYSRYRVSATTDDHKLVWFEDGEKKLFSLPEQKIVQDEEVIERLSSEIEKRAVNPEEVEVGQTDIKTEDEEVKKRLEDLGYM